jgi:tetratricopeptide (TPR) repeat protein
MKPPGASPAPASEPSNEATDSFTMYSRLHLLRFLAVALACIGGPGRGSEAADELIQKGNVYYEKLQPAEALKYYLPAEKLDPNNVDLLVRVSRQYRHLMSEASNKDEKIRLGNIALSYARRAVKIAPDSAEAEVAVAICCGRLLPLMSVKEQIADSRVIKAAVDRALVLDPRNDLAWQILGRWNLGFAELNPIKRALVQLAYGRLPPARFEDAKVCFEKAISLNPNRLLHYVELGRTYADMGKPAEARKNLLKGLSMPPTEKDDPESKERARQILETLR